MRWRLLVDDREIDLPLGTTKLGRGLLCGVVLDDRSVSREHALLIVYPESCSIADLGSKNGVWVNGEQVFAPRILTSRDRIRLGRAEIVLFEVPNVSSLVDTAPRSYRAAQ